ncbi:MAG: 3-deoxy-D-manno-octulosonic acid transferase [Alphaproteobacteria bacterium]|nr:3-deoxy-D-manno-octulosonic acid transferase [Alphaproteobacteria bacterium]
MIAGLYAGAASLAEPGLRLLLARRARRGKEVAARLGERCGIDATPRPPGPLLWLHAASVGEAVSVLPVLEQLAAIAPSARVLFTTGTVTSAALLARRLPELGLGERVLHRFAPLDVPRWAARFLDHWRPDAVAFVESEIWPNLLRACRRRRVPMVLLNARLSARAFARWRGVPGLARTLFGAFACVEAQSAADAARLSALGARAVRAPGNLKFAAPPLAVGAEELARLRTLLHGRPVWLAASTHLGEEAAVLAVHASLAATHPSLLTVIAPRHPERGPVIAAAIAGPPVTRRALGEGPPAAGVWIADTLGELGLLYAAIGIAFVGGSLVAHGGQNVLEPARLGCAVAVGPHVANFAEPVAALEAAGALTRVTDTESLAIWVDGLLRDPARRATMAAAGQAAASRDAGLPRAVAAGLATLLAGGA